MITLKTCVCEGGGYDYIGNMGGRYENIKNIGGEGGGGSEYTET